MSIYYGKNKVFDDDVYAQLDGYNNFTNLNVFTNLSSANGTVDVPQALMDGDIFARGNDGLFYQVPISTLNGYVRSMVSAELTTYISAHIAEWVEN